MTRAFRFFYYGAGNVTRTHDLLITNQLLYRLSYTSTGVFSANESIAQSRAIVKLQFRKEALETVGFTMMCDSRRKKE